ncbi:hypothetical protein EJ02DRAFT_455815 [Clathrospora elynae]|uniref:Uncharacterized protein n=1 Tax=Clathrospora elynae TaxID=706981 RepID=A0A6A5SM45_9PLEO|nr:hypothetical protein EJ02DRAFT_455815 [Clathrospora elynae]
MSSHEDPGPSLDSGPSQDPGTPLEFGSSSPLEAVYSSIEMRSSPNPLADVEMGEAPQYPNPRKLSPQKTKPSLTATLDNTSQPATLNNSTSQNNSSSTLNSNPPALNNPANPTTPSSTVPHKRTADERNLTPEAFRPPPSLDNFAFASQRPLPKTPIANNQKEAIGMARSLLVQAYSFATSCKGHAKYAVACVLRLFTS